MPQLLNKLAVARTFLATDPEKIVPALHAQGLPTSDTLQRLLSDTKALAGQYVQDIFTALTEWRELHNWTEEALQVTVPKNFREFLERVQQARCIYHNLCGRFPAQRSLGIIVPETEYAKALSSALREAELPNTENMKACVAGSISQPSYDVLDLLILLQKTWDETWPVIDLDRSTFLLRAIKINEQYRKLPVLLKNTTPMPDTLIDMCRAQELPYHLEVLQYLEALISDRSQPPVSMFLQLRQLEEAAYAACIKNH